MRYVLAVLVLALSTLSCVPGSTLSDLLNGINGGEPSGLGIPEIGGPVSIQVVSESSVTAQVLIRFLVADIEVHRSELTVPPFATPALIGPDLAAVVEISGAYATGEPTPSVQMILGRDFLENDVKTYVIPELDDYCLDDPDKLLPGFCGCNQPETDSDGDGLPDCVDGCPGSSLKTSPGTCGCDQPDTDGDADGSPDCVDGCPGNPAKVEPGVCGCDRSDADSDGDGASDCIDACPGDSGKLVPGVCGCGQPDSDFDHDGAADCVDACPNNSGKVAPGVCGCGQPDIDSDGDGSLDCLDACPGNSGKTAPGVCGCDQPDIDSDGDEVLDCQDECPLNPGKTEAGPCGCDEAETDSDEDGAPDCIDQCPDDYYKVLPGVCGCGVADVDSNQDGIIDCLDQDHDRISDDGDGSGVPGDNPCRGGNTKNCDDNCPRVPNADQEDADGGEGDGIGRACEVYADFDLDGDVDDADRAHLDYCLGGVDAIRATPQGDGVCFDTNLDQDPECITDSEDLALFLMCYSGEDIPVSQLGNPRCFGEEFITRCEFYPGE